MSVGCDESQIADNTSIDNANNNLITWSREELIESTRVCSIWSKGFRKLLILVYYIEFLLFALTIK